MLSPVPIDTRPLAVTPVFKYERVENVPQSEAQGHPVYETLEMVELHFAGNKHYIPSFRATDFCRREGGKTITYAEQYADAYRAFKSGAPTEAMGTPLEMLKPHGVTDAMISLCRAMRVYSVEALHQLESAGLKSLGMHGNKLKEAAHAYMASQVGNGAALAEIETLKARIAELEQPADEPDAKEALKAEIAEITGARPKGNPSVETLEAMLAELKA